LRVLFQGHTLSSYNFPLTKNLSKRVEISLITHQYFVNRKANIQGIQTLYFPYSKFVWLMPGVRNKYFLNDYLGTKWLKKIIKSNKIDLFHINAASKSNMYIDISKEYNIPFIYTNHYVIESEPFEFFNKKEKLEYEFEDITVNNLIKRASHVVSVSNYAKNVFKKKYGIDSKVIYHGVDLTIFNPDIKVSREKNGYQNSDKIVLWVSRFGNHPYKDPYTFINAIPIVLKELPGTQFIMVGNGPHKKPCIELSKQLSIKNNLRFIDYVDKIEEMYALSDVFVLTSYNDNFGLVVTEAMGCGKPVIVSDRGAPKEYIEDNGLIFQYGDPDSLAKAILEILSDNDKRCILGERCFNYVKNNFSWRNAAEKYLELYENI